MSNYIRSSGVNTESDVRGSEPTVGIIFVIHWGWKEKRYQWGLAIHEMISIHNNMELEYTFTVNFSLLIEIAVRSSDAF